MDRDSINLFKNRFLDYNRVRYKENVNWLTALNTLTVDDINVLEYVPDPESKYRTVLTEVQSAKFHLTGLDQKYTKAYFGTDVIAKLSDRTIYPDLVSILNMNIKGVFFYENTEEPEFPHVVIATNFLYKWDDGYDFINEVMTNVNEHTRYDILHREVSVEKDDVDSSGDRIVVNVEIDNHTIWGTIKVGQIPAKYPLGAFPYEYMGKFGEHHLIGKEALLTLANIVDSPMDEQYRLDTALVWLKFRYFGKVVYVPKYPILTDVSWDQLNQRQLVGGKTIITAADGQEYRLRLLNISDSEGDNEWDNLIKRCINGSGMTEWETFNYTTEMQYGYEDRGQSFHSSVLTEGLADEEQRYLVGISGDPTTKVPIPRSQSVHTAGAHTSYAGWLPVLELRGVDPIDANTVHPQWMDLRDPIPNQVYAEQTPPDGMAFAVRLHDMEYLGPDEPDLGVVGTNVKDAVKLTLMKVEMDSSVPEPDLTVSTMGTGSVNKVTLLTCSNPALDEGILDVSPVSKPDAFYIWLRKHTVQFANVVEGYALVKDETKALLKRVVFKRVSVSPIAMKAPQGKVGKSVVPPPIIP